MQVSPVVRGSSLVVFLVACMICALTGTSSYQKIDGAIVDPILHANGTPHWTLQANLAPHVDLPWVDLRHANLYQSDLIYPDLANANLINANLFNADLADTDLDGANLINLKNLETTRGSSHYYLNTTLPSDFDPVDKGWDLAPYCHFTGDTNCDVLDINQMFEVGDLVTGIVTSANTERFDLFDDDTIDAADITEWLSQAAATNGHGSPYQRGDTELDARTSILATSTVWPPTSILTERKHRIRGRKAISMVTVTLT